MDCPIPSPIAFICRNFNLRGGQSRIAWELGRRCADDGAEVHFVARRLFPLDGRGERIHPHRVFQWPRFCGEWVRFRSFARSSSMTAEKIVSGTEGVVHGFGDNYRQDILTLGNVDWSYPKYIPGRTPSRSALFVKSAALRDPGLRCLVLVSRQMKQEVMEFVPDFDESKMKVVYPGIDVERFKKHDRNESRKIVSERFGIPGDKVWILFGAGGDFEKRNVASVYRGLCATMESKDWVFVMLGADGDLPPLPRELSGRTFRLGHMSDVSPVLAACDVLVYPAWYDEYSLMAAEAMASGLPVITTKTVGVNEVFPRDFRGESVMDNPGDVEDLRRKILLFVGNAALRRKAGETNRKAIQATSWDNVYQRYTELYLEVSRGKSPGKRPSPLSI